MQHVLNWELTSMIHSREPFVSCAPFLTQMIQLIIHFVRHPIASSARARCLGLFCVQRNDIAFLPDGGKCEMWRESCINLE